MPKKVNITLTTGTMFAWLIAKFEQDPQGRAAIMALFWSFVQRSIAGECWLYQDTDALGCDSAALFAWLASRGPIPAGSSLYRACAHASCVNPTHLQVRSDSADGDGAR